MGIYPRASINGLKPGLIFGGTTGNFDCSDAGIRGTSSRDGMKALNSGFVLINLKIPRGNLRKRRM
jgi:hypothetical protein